MVSTQDRLICRVGDMVGAVVSIAVCHASRDPGHQQVICGRVDMCVKRSAGLGSKACRVLDVWEHDLPSLVMPPITSLRPATLARFSLLLHSHLNLVLFIGSYRLHFSHLLV